MKKTLITLLTSSILITSPIVANAKTVKPFEGSWHSCFMYQGSKICTGYTLLQRKQNVCGNWSYFATGIYQGQLQAIANGRTTAKLTKICGRSGSNTQTECKTNPLVADETNWEIPTGDVTALKLCNGKLVEGSGSCKSLIKQNSGYRYSALSSVKKQKLLAEPWMQSCLTEKPIR
jgi:hypothetical protein